MADFLVLEYVLHVYELQVHRLQCSIINEQFLFDQIFRAENRRLSHAILFVLLGSKKFFWPQLVLRCLLEEVINFL